MNKVLGILLLLLLLRCTVTVVVVKNSDRTSTVIPVDGKLDAGLDIEIPQDTLTLKHR